MLDPADAHLDRRFGGLRRLYGDAGYARVRAARIAVVGLGGVGSWTVEALARSGVAQLVLIDLDHVGESNINRQVQATTSTLGQAKGEALRERIHGIHPSCEVVVIDEFVDSVNFQSLLTGAGIETIDALVDACDQVRAKVALAVWAKAHGARFVTVGAAGGKRWAQKVEIADLSLTTHDPLLAALRNRLRREQGAARQGRIGVDCVFSREPVAQPVQAADACDIDAGSAGAGESADGSLNCHGYGSSVTVTATFGLVAAGQVLNALASDAK